ncbi:MAG: hypothetical protein AAF004_01930 [Pseudomonadota bacterium]
MAKTRLIFTGVAFALLAGCGTQGGCETRDDYQNVEQIGQIEVPENLDGLPQTERLQIPVSSTPPDVEARCLEKPPRFSDDNTAAGT